MRGRRRRVSSGRLRRARWPSRRCDHSLSPSRIPISAADQGWFGLSSRIGWFRALAGALGAGAEGGLSSSRSTTRRGRSVRRRVIRSQIPNRERRLKRRPVLNSPATFSRVSPFRGAARSPKSRSPLTPIRALLVKLGGRKASLSTRSGAAALRCLLAEDIQVRAVARRIQNICDA